MKSTTSNFRRTIIAAALLATALSFNAKAQIIIQDSFDVSGVGGDVIGRSGDARKPAQVDAPNGFYRTINYFGQADSTIVNTGNPAPSLSMSANNQILISIASNGTYVKPATFNISADLQVADLGLIELGFGTNNGSQDYVTSNKGFEGVSLDSTGKLQLWEAGSAAGTSTTIASYNASKFGGLAFDPNTFYNLSFNVNTATGDISLITLSKGGYSATYDILATTFTDPNTAALIVGSAGAGGKFGNIDNLLLGPALVPPPPIPEPSTWAFLVLALGGLGIAVRRRQLN